MSDVNAGEISAEGRPSAGAELVQNLAEAANRRPRRKDIRPLAHLLPFVRRHKIYALLAGFFLLFSTAATLGLTATFKGVVDKGFAKGAGHVVDSAFLMMGAVALVLAAATALRFLFVTRLGERVVADLRRAIYDHVLTLDPAFFLKTRTGEVLSRMTTDITIVEQLVGASVSIALRNSLSLIGGLSYMAVVSPKLAGFIVLMVPVAFLVTVAANVPRNDVIAALDPGDRSAEGAWAKLRRSWTRWNHVRVTLAILAAALLGVALHR